MMGPITATTQGGNYKRGILERQDQLIPREGSDGWE